jgi:hypothetical protein
VLVPTGVVWKNEEERERIHTHTHTHTTRKRESERRGSKNRRSNPTNETNSIESGALADEKKHEPLLLVAPSYKGEPSLSLSLLVCISYAYMSTVTTNENHPHDKPENWNCGPMQTRPAND